MYSLVARIYNILYTRSGSKVPKSLIMVGCFVIATLPHMDVNRDHNLRRC